MTRQQFLKLEFPNLPYCEFGLKRGASSKFWETYHYKNASTKKKLNVFWHYDESVSIDLYDGKKPNSLDNKKEILASTKNFTQNDLTNYCNLYLK